MGFSWAGTPVTQSYSAPQPRDFSEAAVVALRSALQARLRGAAPDPTLRRAIRLMCDEGRRQDMRAEQLLIILKRAWQSLPEVFERTREIRRDDVLGRVITMCIEEYYTEGRQQA